MKAHRGLTLIELAVVLAVISLITAGAVLSFRLVDRRVLENASLTLQADLRYAQRMAIIEGRNFGLFFHQDSYTISELEPNKIDIKTVMLPDGVLFQVLMIPRVYFLPRGTISTGFSVTLEKGRFFQEITGLPSSGRIDIKNIRTY